MEFDLKNVKEFEPNTIFLEDGQFLENYKSGNIDLTDGLPNGILDKRYTGVGATTVEIKSSRKSIIVFPFRKLALEKFEKYEKTRTVFYVGTDKKNNSKSIDDIAFFTKENQDKDIKFLVVADSIDKVVKGIEKAGFNPYKDYFLVLDEVEILQFHSQFRIKLPLCFEYFKDFTGKCLVSATLINFSDKVLKKLPIINVEKKEFIKEEGYLPYFENLQFRKYGSEFPHIEVAQDLLKFYQKDPANLVYKFFIGLNSKEAISQFIKEIEKVSKSITISVFASDGAPDNFLDKYTNYEKNKGILPCQINLTTCVAWSGIDIKEPFFSIAISLNTKVHHSFSFENLIQFFGRCRLPKREQLAKTFVIGKNPQLAYKRSDGTYKTRISDVENLLTYIGKNITSKSDRKKILNSLIKSNTNLIYKDKEDKPIANWLLKDLESYTEKFVADYDNLENGILKRLKTRYKIKEVQTLVRDIDILKKTSEEKLEERLQILISNLGENYEDSKLIQHVRNTKIPTLRIAAFWFLFGRRILKNNVDSIKLAKYYSGFNKEINRNNLLQITRITLESIYLYQYEIIIWERLINELKKVCQGAKKKNAKDFQHVFEKSDFKDYCTNIKTPNSIGFFFKYILEITSSGKTGGSDTFLIEDTKTYKPKLIRDFPLIKKSLNQTSKFLKNNKNNNGVSFGKTSVKDILSEDFKIWK